MIRRTYITIFLVAMAVVATAQSQYTVNNKASELEVTGTSTLHDWELKAEKLTGKASVEIGGDKLDIASLNFSAATEGLKSDKDAMDNNAYKALKSDEYANITYTLVKAEQVKGSGSAYTLSTSGKLTIAGHSKSINMPVTATTSSNSISFKGSITFKMSDFKVEPPTLFMGTLKTGDEITINFNVTYSK